MTILFSIGFTVSIFSIIQLARKENYSISDKLSTAILSVWALRFSLFYLKENVDLISSPWLYFVDQCLFFIDGPLLYLYTKSLLQKKIKKKSIWHFATFFLALALTVHTYLQIPKDEWLMVIEQLSTQIEQEVYSVSLEEGVFIFGILIHNIVYSLLSLKDVRKLKRMMLTNLSTINNSGVEWLLKFIKFWLLVLLIPLVIYFTNYIFPIIHIQYLEMFLIISLVVSAIYFGVKTIEQENVGNYSNEVVQDAKVIKKEISDKQIEMLLKLRKFMIEKKPFLEVDLNLDKLANLIEFKPNELSYIINNGTNGNFHDFVNEYRIESVKRELNQSNEQIILIAYSNGFNSKSTFNTVFKKKVGMTPSQYRKSLSKKS